MNNLIQFLQKNFHFLLFIVLQIIAIVLIYHSMSYPRFKISTMGKVMTGPFYEAHFHIKKHFNFESENQSLVQQNIALLREQEKNFIMDRDTVVQVVDEISAKQNIRLYDYFYANVIHNTIHKKNNYLIIDKGAKDGVEIDMAVICPEGVVGVVNDVSDHFASIISVLHSDSRISAKIYPSNQLGNIIWEEGDAESALLLDIPQHIHINVGDSVFTSGYSYVFPKDILIGTISEKKEDGKSSFWRLKVKLSTRFSRLNTIYLVKNIYKTELNSLQSNFKNE